MANRKTKPLSAADTAVKELDQTREAIASLRQELEDLEHERTALEARTRAGSLDVDPDQADDLNRKITSRRSRLADLEDRILPLRTQAVVLAELTDLADGIAEGASLADARAAYMSEREAAEAQITEAVERIRTAAATWNSTISPLVTKARSAGLVDGKVDPFARAYADPRALALHVDGDTYRVVDPDAAVDLAVANARSTKETN